MHDDGVGRKSSMNVIFVGRKSGRVKEFDLRHPLVVGAALLTVLRIVGAAFSVGGSVGTHHGAVNRINQLGNWSAELMRQQAQIEDVKRVLQEKVNALALRVGQMNANVIRVNALGKGLDFAGPQGTKVVSVAAGLVTFAGERAGYGQMVEINHGNGLATRYCHNEKLLVKQGDMVRKGQDVALMGSTGRSTGPHLHFEVLKNGAQVDPLRFIGEDR